MDDMVMAAQCKVDFLNLLAQLLIVGDSHMGESDNQVAILLVPEVVCLVIGILSHIDVVELALVVLSEQGQPLLLSDSKESNPNAIPL
jgi:hypothetical protein